MIRIEDAISLGELATKAEKLRTLVERANRMQQEGWSVCSLTLMAPPEATSTPPGSTQDLLLPTTPADADVSKEVIKLIGAMYQTQQAKLMTQLDIV